MGDTMILNENEVSTCMEYALKPLLKTYSVYIKESQLFIQDDHIEIKAVVIYQDHVFDLNTSFQIAYKNKCLCFYEIDGKVEYLFLQLNVMSILQQVLNDEHIHFKNNTCYYECDLPIEDIHIQDKQLCVILKE